MLRYNRPMNQMPDWVSQFMNQLLTPPPFLAQSEAKTADSQPSAKPAEPTRSSASHTRQPATPTEAKVTRTTAAPVTTDEVRVEPERRWRAALIHSEIPQSALFAYGWDILDVKRYQHILRVSADDGDFALKSAHMTPQRVRFLAKAMEYAEQHDFHRIARISETTRGKPYVQFDGHTYYASRWIEGQEANFASPNQVAQVARALAEWHEATRYFRPDGYQPDGEFSLRLMLQRRLEELRELIATADRQVHTDDFDATLQSLGPTLIKDAKHSVELVSTSHINSFLEADKKHAGICHLDVIPSNFIYTKDREMHLLDLDLATYAPRALDMAHLLRRSLERSQWNTEMAYQTFLQFDEVRALDTAEYAIVRAMLTFPYRAWRLAHTRYHLVKDSAQVEDLARTASEEQRRQAFLDSYSRQIDAL